MLPDLLSTPADWTETFIRIVLRVVLFAHGAQSGLRLILGFSSRPAAVGVAVTMLMAILPVNSRNGRFRDWFGGRKAHGYEYHPLAITLAVAVMVRGAGAICLDRFLSSSLGV